MPHASLKPKALTMKNHHNTTNLTGTNLDEANDKAQGQQVAIMQFFTARPGGEYTACQVYGYLTKEHNHTLLLTSVRRAITNLASAGLLIKTANRQVGAYGALAYTWKLARITSATPGTQLALA